jgi:signal transduction histidine kinase
VVVTGGRLPVRSLTGAELIAVDCLAALLLGATYLTGLWRPTVAVGLVWWTRGLILLLIALPAAVRRVWPLSIFGIVTAASTLALLFGILPDPFVASAATAYSAADTRRIGRRGWWMVAAVSAVLLLVSVSAGSVSPPPDALRTLLPGTAVVGSMWALGVAVRERRAFGEREVESRLARAVLDERLRLARDVHDIVTHNLGVIAVKSAVARHVARTKPDEALAALEVIEGVSRAALADMRQALRVLRSGPVDREEPSLEDQPYGLADIRSLVQRAGVAGLDIHCELPDRDEVPRGVARSAYRIVQEALTNVIKHAGPTRCEVRVHSHVQELLIEVRNDSPQRGRPISRNSSPLEGYGMIGVRERVAMHGGEVVVAKRDDGGYQLSVTLPYPAETPSDGG